MSAADPVMIGIDCPVIMTDATPDEGAGVVVEPAGTAYYSTDIHPDAFEQNLYGDFADYAAWLASVQSRFSAHFSNPSAMEFSESLLFDDEYHTLIVREGNGTTEGGVMYANQDLATPLTKLWTRTAFYISPTAAPASVSDSFVAMPAAFGDNESNGLTVNPTYKPNPGEFSTADICGGAPHFSFALNTLRGAWHWYVTYSERSPSTSDTALFQSWVDGVLVENGDIDTSCYPFTGSGFEYIQLAYSWVTSGTKDPTNNWIAYGLDEWVSGDGLTEPPYTGLETP